MGCSRTIATPTHFMRANAVWFMAITVPSRHPRDQQGRRRHPVKDVHREVGRPPRENRLLKSLALSAAA